MMSWSKFQSSPEFQSRFFSYVQIRYILMNRSYLAVFFSTPLHQNILPQSPGDFDPEAHLQFRELPDSFEISIQRGKTSYSRLRGGT